MQRVIMLSVVMMNVVRLSVIMLSVVAPKTHLDEWITMPRDCIFNLCDPSMNEL